MRKRRHTTRLSYDPIILIPHHSTGKSIRIPSIATSTNHKGRHAQQYIIPVRRDHWPAAITIANPSFIHNIITSCICISNGQTAQYGIGNGMTRQLITIGGIQIGQLQLQQHLTPRHLRILGLTPAHVFHHCSIAIELQLQDILIVNIIHQRNGCNAG